MSYRQQEELNLNEINKFRVKTTRVIGYLNSDRIKSSLEEKNQHCNYFNDKITNNEVERLNTISSYPSNPKKSSMHSCSNGKGFVLA